MATAQKQYPGIAVDEAVLPGPQPRWIEVDEQSGLVDRVVEAVRESKDGKNVKLFLFTADEWLELFENAKKVGVGMVVVKIPDAAEIVNLVREEVTSGI